MSAGEGEVLIKLPALSLVVLVGPSGSGKSTFAAERFLPTEVLSSDACRALVRDDANDQEATSDAFAVLHFIAAKRLAAGRLTVIDATSVRPEDRRSLVQLAREHHCLPCAVVFDLPERTLLERNERRADRNLPAGVVRRQQRDMRRGLRGLKREGFRAISILRSEDDVRAARIERTRMWSDRRDERGPFDIVGDVHGCCDELEELLGALGYARRAEPGEALGGGPVFVHPEGRRLIFVGDLVDRGPRNLDVLRLVANTALAGHAYAVPGNHDAKLLKKLQGRKVKIAHGLARTLEEIDALDEAERATLTHEASGFIDGLVSHLVLDDGRLVVAHAGIKEAMQGRGSAAVRAFCLFGETTGETDDLGLPVRIDWARGYRGRASVVYGHTVVAEPEWLNGTLNIDTGCVFGGRLTALRWPERDLVSVPARRVWCEPTRPLPAARGDGLSAQQADDGLLHLEDVSGKRFIATRIQSRVTVPAPNAAAALEVMSRFAIDPRWLIHLPPTMSPCETSEREGWLERPEEAFAYFRSRGALRVVCEEKHMGSRAVLVVCRDADVARERFGDASGRLGVCYTRTGRAFFDDAALEEALLERVRAAAESAGLWDELETGWLCIDAELLPWSAKAQDLLERQYARVGAAGGAYFDRAVAALDAASHLEGASALLERFRARRRALEGYVEAYRGYCWPVAGLEDLAIAPFHLLASEGAVHADKTHRWHLDVLGRLCDAGGALFRRTGSREVALGDANSEADAAGWWEQRTAEGAEGMVVKPLELLARGAKGWLQPALKCRGREYLRIIYGPEYTLPEHLVRLRKRGVSAKRSLAMRELALGLEALERFVRREPLRRVHECVFGVLALECEPVDPRL